MSKAPTPAAVLSSLILILFVEPTAGGSFTHICSPSSGNYTANSTYEANVNLLLSSLSSNTHITGFSNASFGSIPNRVSGLALCQGDVVSSICRECVRTAVSDAPQLCPYSKSVSIWYDACYLRYSNERILSSMDSTMSRSFFNVKKVNASELERFNLTVMTLLSAISDYAVNNSTTPPLFAAGDILYDSSEYPRLYGLVQCTRDISAAECYECLQHLISDYGRCSNCTDAIGQRFLAGSCGFRRESTGPFYNWSVKLLYPSVRPKTPLPFSQPPTSASPPGGLGDPGVAPFTGKRKKRTMTILTVSILVGFASILVFSFAYIYLRPNKSKERTSETPDPTKRGIPVIESFLFEWHVIIQATNNFSPVNKLGEGGNGSVYKGVLQDGKEIAVKRPQRSSVQGDKQLANEVKLLARLRHRNLVRLLGVCLDGEEKLLIYEFVANGSLDDVLFDPQRKEQLNWERRKKIITGIGRGLLYLHEESQLKIIHRDMKASNILLDRDINPIIADFGTARLFDADQTHASTNVVVGTFGYMAPEYVMRGHVSEKLDVYSFGILILEIITGRRNTDFIISANSTDLLSYVWENWSNNTISEMIDPSLGVNFHDGEVRRCIQIGLLCVQEQPSDRPTMSSIVLQLSGASAFIHFPARPNLPGGYNVMAERSAAKSNALTHTEGSITEFEPR